MFLIDQTAVTSIKEPSYHFVCLFGFGRIMPVGPNTLEQAEINLAAIF